MDDVAAIDRNGMRPNRSMEPEDNNNQVLDSNAGLFIWPVIMFLFITVGLMFGYLLFWEH